MKKMLGFVMLYLLAFCPSIAWSTVAKANLISRNPLGFIAFGSFVAALYFVAKERKFHLRKSKPVILAASFIWILVAVAYNKVSPGSEVVEKAMVHYFAEFAGLYLFLLPAMTYINALEKRNVFECIKSWILKKGFSFRQIFWLSGVAAFLISPLADNMTTAMVFGSIVVIIGSGFDKFIATACTNIVVAANAGGVFSQFGDITTLMVWGARHADDFLALFVPALVAWFVPALIMSFTLSNEKREKIYENTRMLLGAKRIMLLFVLTIVTAVLFRTKLNLPPAAGMMLGFGLLSIFAWWLKIKERKIHLDEVLISGEDKGEMSEVGFDIMKKVALAEWDTIHFFYGVILCVGGLAQFGYLNIASDFLYNKCGTTNANISVGIISAFIDNIPVMFAVLEMNPQMSLGQWLLVTLTAGIGGSLISFGSAAGVALMGQSKGGYGFWEHLRWTPAIFLGYVASICSHMYINRALF